MLCTFFDYAINDENVLLPRNPARSKHVTVKYSEKDSHIRDVHPPEMIREIIRGDRISTAHAAQTHGTSAVQRYAPGRSPWFPLGRFQLQAKDH